MIVEVYNNFKLYFFLFFLHSLNSLYDFVDCLLRGKRGNIQGKGYNG